MAPELYFVHLSYIVFFLPQVYDVNQRQKWSIHGWQRQLRLPHSKPWVSIPEGSTHPSIKHSFGWGELFLLPDQAFLPKATNRTCKLAHPSWAVSSTLSLCQFFFFYQPAAPPQIIDRGCETSGERNSVCPSVCKACQQCLTESPIDLSGTNDVLYTFESHRVVLPHVAATRYSLSQCCQGSATDLPLVIIHGSVCYWNAQVIEVAALHWNCRWVIVRLFLHLWHRVYMKRLTFSSSFWR